MTRADYFSSWTQRVAMTAILALTSSIAQAQLPAGSDWRYTVRPQDTTSEIAQRFLQPSIGWTALAKHNALRDPNMLIAGQQLRIPIAWLAGRQASAILASVTGDVKIKTTEGVWRQAQEGEPLSAGQQIQVSTNSSAQLRFADDSELVVQPSSSVLLDTLSSYAGGYMVDTQVRLQAGRVEVHANPQARQGQRFDVATPAAVASVRGTEFLVEADTQRMLAQTTSGRVAVETAQGEVVVKPGFSSTAKQGEKPLAPEPIQPSPTLKDPVQSFTDFPIAFTLESRADFTLWVTQVGLDSQLTQVVLSTRSDQPRFDAGALADGSYYLRAWTLDGLGVPSQTSVYPFQVSIPRTLQGPAMKLPLQYFAGGPVQLKLAPLAANQRYLIQITRDEAGRNPVWYQADAGASPLLPVQPAQDQPYFLWIWTY